MTKRVNFDLTGQVVIVTGASKGIGKAIALAAAEWGADLALGNRNPADCAEVVEECRAMGRRVEAGERDVWKVESINAFIDQTVETFGGFSGTPTVITIFPCAPSTIWTIVPSCAA